MCEGKVNVYLETAARNAARGILILFRTVFSSFRPGEPRDCVWSLRALLRGCR